MKYWTSWGAYETREINQHVYLFVYLFIYLTILPISQGDHCREGIYMKQKRNTKQSFLACKTIGNQYMTISSNNEQGEGTNHCKTTTYNYNDKVYNDTITLSIYRSWILNTRGQKQKKRKRTTEFTKTAQRVPLLLPYLRTHSKMKCW